MQYLLYFVIYFRVQSTTREVFVVDALDVALANHKIFTQQHAHDAEVTSTQYMKVNGTTSPFGSDITLLKFQVFQTRFSNQKNLNMTRCQKTTLVFKDKSILTSLI